MRLTYKFQFIHEDMCVQEKKLKWSEKSPMQKHIMFLVPVVDPGIFCTYYHADIFLLVRTTYALWYWYIFEAYS